MIWKVTTLLSLVVCVLGFSHHKAVSEQKVTQHFELRSGKSDKSGLSHIGGHKPEHHGEYAWSYPSYEFSYKVKDPHTHDHKGQHETRDGDNVKGEYWLMEPHGGKRVVSYHADKHNGYQAVVHYSVPHHHVHHKSMKHHEGDERGDEEGQDDKNNGDGLGGEEQQGQDEGRSGEEQGGQDIQQRQEEKQGLNEYDVQEGENGNRQEMGNRGWGRGGEKNKGGYNRGGARSQGGQKGRGGKMDNGGEKGNDERQAQPSYHRPMPYQFRIHHNR